jgi:hypothetical protein
MKAPDVLIALAAADGFRLRDGPCLLMAPAVSAPWGQRHATLAHIALVYRRARTIRCSEASDRKPLLVASLIYELTGPTLHRAAHRLCDGRSARAACRIVEHFGAIWRLAETENGSTMVQQLGADLKLYLLFELAHEGRPPPRWREVWDAARLGPMCVGGMRPLALVRERRLCTRRRVL